MKTILITGASSGIGKSLAQHYSEHGWQVIAGGRNEQALNELASQYANVTPLVADLCDEQAVINAAAHLSKLDVMLLNAGSCEYVDDPVHFDAALFQRVINTNLMTVAYCLNHWLCKVKQGGQLAFTSSSASFLPLPRAQAYGASKAALSYMARTLSIDLAPHNIDVSVINPGFVETPLTDKNDFPMPGRISSEDAAKAIYHGLSKRRHTINFPSFFTLVLSMLAGLPFSWWRAFAIRNLIRKTS